ncbi:MAG: HupE/UreJ family protein [Acidobacteria bacterium]|nr:HupE/UreJ family protein [Acidobacteriota bacterium]NIT11061.1 HupE/UreJ family protein [Acidobacteriota bacterium]
MPRPVFALAALVPAVLTATPTAAHEVRPGYLEIKQTAAEAYDVLWKVPAKGDLRLGIYARLPRTCENLRPPSTYSAGGAFTDRWTADCPGGLTGQTIVIDGLESTLTDVLVRFERLDGTVQSELLAPKSPSFVVAATQSWAGIAATYLELGVEHILLGIDHLLFVLALLILVEGKRRLIGTVTAFTVAHSITLAAATLGLVNVPQQPVEAVIALSIVFVAAEIVHARQGKPGMAQRWPWVVAFSFGLLHGFGFAGALTEVGLPGKAIPLALLFFNIGVELGQLAFITVVILGIALAKRLPVPRPAWAWRIPAYGIGAMATYWTLERVSGFCG